MPKYSTNAMIPLTDLLDTFSIDFAGPLPKSKEGTQYMLIAVEHLINWPIAVATQTATAAEVIRFVNEEIIYSFVPPKTIFSGNANAFTATALVEFLAKRNIGWRAVLAYAPMSNGKAERMVGTIKRAISKTLQGKGSPASEWEEILNRVLYGYRIREMEGGLSQFELMYGIAPKNRKELEPSSLTTGITISLELELMAALGRRATRIAKQRAAARRRAPPGLMFAAGDQVLVLKCKATSMIKKWPIDKSKFHGPCRVFNARRPMYTLASAKESFSCRAIHKRKLVPFIQKPPRKIYG